MVSIDAAALWQRVLHSDDLLSVVVSALFDPLSALDHVRGFDDYKSVVCWWVLQMCFVSTTIVECRVVVVLKFQSNGPRRVVER